jgi:hypothetical protein
MSGRIALAGFCAAAFALSLVALVTAQLALMSVLDATRAERAAEQIAESRFTADVIEQTVINAVAPIAGDQLAQEAAGMASGDPRVSDVVAEALIAAHRQVVDAEAPEDPPDGNVAVGSAIVTAVLDAAAANGIDPATLGLGEASTATPGEIDPEAVAGDMGLPSVVPTDPPRLGLRQIAETTRTIALIGVIVFGLGAVLIHPRPGRSLRSVGLTVAVVTGLWLVAMLVAGWIIGAVADTLFGEMIDAVWSDAVPSMLLLTGAGVVIGTGLVVGGIALDGFRRR